MKELCPHDKNLDYIDKNQTMSIVASSSGTHRSSQKEETILKRTLGVLHVYLK